MLVKQEVGCHSTIFSRGPVSRSDECLEGILSKFDLGSTLSTILFCDNQSAIHISMDPITRHRTKHVEIHMHYIRELVHDTAIILQYYPTDEQIADIFTKRFLEKKFTYLHSLLGVSSSG